MNRTQIQDEIADLELDIDVMQMDLDAHGQGYSMTDRELRSVRRSLTLKLRRHQELMGVLRRSYQ